ncbi:GyrI-like domain-containing protein [Methylocapsa palsarum]|nr:GyrI-like domain-containing protein [Methylocapsa palsarum]
MIEPLRIIETAPRLTAFISVRIPREEIRNVMGPGLAELRAAVAAQNIVVTGPWFTHHLRRPDEIFDFEISVPVAAPVAPVNRTNPGQWPAMRVARTIYHGGYEGLGAAWGEFMGEIKAAGRRTADDLWECYLIGPETSADPAAWRTELSKRLVET